MILLEPGNRVLAETIAGALRPPVVAEVDDEDKKSAPAKAERDPMDVRLCDFDDVGYHITIDHANRSELLVSMNLPCYREIENKGASEALKRIYKEMVTEPENGYEVSLKINLDKLSGKEDEIARRVELMKTNIVGAVFDTYFTALLAGKSLTENFKFQLRSDTLVYFMPRNDKIIIVYEIDFTHKVDIAIAKIFMQEFIDCKKRLGAAPPCQFSQNPPLEMKEFGITDPTRKLGYATFAVMKSHLENNRKEKIIITMQMFRNYLAYHIKCSKAFFHSRMRARVVSLIKVLNRAKVEVDESKREKKTAQGKTFIRQS